MERRVLTFFVLSFLVIFGMNYLNLKLHPRPVQPVETTPPAASTTPAPVPTTTATLAAATPRAEATPKSPTTPAAPAVPRAAATTVTLTTKVYDLAFSLKGAIPVRWDITDSRFVVPPAGESRETMRKKGIKASEPLIDPDLKEYDQLPHPFETVLQESSNVFYNNFNSDLYTAEKITSGTLSGYRFTSPPAANGLKMVKTYLFRPDDPNGFTGAFKVELINGGKYNLVFDRAGAGLGIVLGPGLGKVPENYTRNTVVDPAIKGPESVFYRKPTKPGESETFPGDQIDWGGLQSLYFLNVLIPQTPGKFVAARVELNADVVGTVATDRTRAFYPDVELYSPGFKIEPGQRQAFSYEFFCGPKKSEILKAADHDLDRSLFFSSWNWMRALALALSKVLVWLHAILFNWGVAIIVLTIIVRILAFPLVQKGMKSQAKMMAEQARLKPLMDKINEKYKNDPQRKQQEIFKLYKEHGVNPFGAFKGCAWMMIQMPIFIALYFVINQSVDLRGAHFLWIQDLSQPDRLFHLPFTLPLLGAEFNLLPIVMAATQILTSKFSTTTAAAADPQQAEMQKTMTWFMPIFMLFIFYGMPSGLVLYWTVSNIWQVLQQLWVNKHMPGLKAPVVPAGPAPRKA